MRTIRILGSLMMMLGSAMCSRGDQITAGKLDFTCVDCVAPVGGASTAPAHGSFSFDNTTGEFLNVVLTWDGMKFDGTDVQNPVAMYQQLTTTGLPWSAACVSFEPDCGTVLQVVFSTPLGFIDFLPEPNSLPRFSYDLADGTVSATHLKDPAATVPTPEPATVVYLLVSALIAFLVKKLLWRL
jgi:hypothetical protein